MSKWGWKVKANDADGENNNMHLISRVRKFF